LSYLCHWFIQGYVATLSIAVKNGLKTNLTHVNPSKFPFSVAALSGDSDDSITFHEFIKQAAGYYNFFKNMQYLPLKTQIPQCEEV
jgi:hypothetical protein